MRLPVCVRVERVSVAGGMAGALMAFVNCPVELLKVRLQTQDRAGPQQVHPGGLWTGR